jgi:hypothetical protein
MFKDLEFEPNELGGVGTHHTFENGITISVQASKFAYCEPRENLASHEFYASFEVALWDDDLMDQIIPRQNRKEIDVLINKLNK